MRNLSIRVVSSLARAQYRLSYREKGKRKQACQP